MKADNTGQPKVAICMAAYNPPSQLFRRQIESIKAQTFTKWTCTIAVDADDRGVIAKTLGDDPRFKIVRNPHRLGFYRNFEKAISIAPSSEFIALSDQDDFWFPDKLETLLSAFTPQTQLVYSDCRIVAEEGEVISPTFWHNRRNNFTNLACLVTANTVTGAASMFRASLLPQILPLPADIRDTYHDHWIAIVAAANGDIGYIDQPLYDYVQHGSNVIGHNYSNKCPGLLVYTRELLRHVKRPSSVRGAVREITRQGVENFGHARRVALLARTALARSGCRGKKRRILSRLARYDSGLVVPVTERTRAALDRRPSLNVEGLLLFVAVAKWAHRVGLITLPPPPSKPRAVASLPPAEFDSQRMPQYLFFQHPLDED